MSGSSRRLRTSIRLTVVAVFLLATALTAALAIGLQYYFGQATARQSAAELYTAAAAGIAARLENVRSVNDVVMALLAANPDLARDGDEQAKLRVFTSVLERNPMYYGVYLGRDDDSFFQVINLDNSSYARTSYRAVPSDRWLVTAVYPAESGYERRLQYLDKDLRSRLTRTEATDYAVTSRPWYRAALATDELTTTAPYLFAQLGIPGQTLSRRIPGTGTVIGIDSTMSTISAFLQESAKASRSEIYLYNSAGEVMASSANKSSGRGELPVPKLTLTKDEKEYVRSLPVLKVSNELDWPPFDFAQGGQPRGYSIDVMDMLAQMTGLKLSFVNGYSWPELKEQYQRGDIDLLHSVIPSGVGSDLGLSGRGYARLPFALATRADTDSPSDLPGMEGRTLAIPAGWSVIPLIRTQFPGINILEARSTLHALELVTAGEADAAFDNEIIMRYIARHYFLDGLQYHSGAQAGSDGFPDTLHIMVPQDRPQLRAILDKAIAALGPAQLNYLEATWLDFESDAGANVAGTLPDQAMIDIAASPALQNKLAESGVDGDAWLLYVAPTSASADTAGQLYAGVRAPLDQVVEPFMEQVELSIAATAALLLLLVPFSWLFANPIVHPIRQLAAENDKVRKRQYDQVERVSSRVLELDELSESMVNMVEAIRAHELAQRKLMDSFIELIAQAIDDKSAYTGGHCERVPELALMLARRASDSALPAFREFRLATDDQWREYRIAAWLHDCGKITTPEHIVDKGSKLETIYNRIHEVRMRFEVLWRDADIAYWQTVAKQPEDIPAAAAALQARQQQLQEDFCFVARCNVGGEFLGEAELNRLREIAKTTWQRNFDNRIGLSPTEELRLNPEPTPLPATETLLSDKPEHLIKRTGSTDYPAEFAINMEVPQYLSNLGEVYNLSISRGTLTAEDRFRINEHMISTIKMLESLPFPQELSKVPRYASTHHETMRGSGYPRKLPGAELSIPERLLAVADVFEALTASDRPYKKAKPVSEALDILHRMVLDEHIDRDCFELLVREEVYLQYARQYLEPAQIDTVDARKYLS